MADFNLTSVSPLTPYRKKKLTENVANSIRERSRMRAQRAAATVSQASKTSPELSIRQRQAVKEAMGDENARARITDQAVLEELERRSKMRRDAAFLEENPRTAEWASNPDNAAIAHDDLENVGWWEGFNRALSKRTDALVDNAAFDFKLESIWQEMERLADQKKTLAELAQDERQEVLDNRPSLEDFARRDEPNLPGPPQEVTPTDQEREEYERRQTELSVTEGLSADAKGLFRYLSATNPYVRAIIDPVGSARTAALGGADEEELADEELDTLVDRGYEAKERELIWPTHRARREFEKAAIAGDGATAQEALTKFATATADDPLNAIRYMLEIGAENGVSLLAGMAVRYATKNPLAGMGTTFATSEEVSSGLFFDELVQQYGYDISTRQGVKDFLADPRVKERMKNKADAYGITVGVLDAMGAGVAGKTLAKSPVGNMVLQGMAQSGLAGSGEFLGRIAAGEPVNWSEVLLEALADVVTAPFEVMSTLGGRANRKIKQAQQQKSRKQLFNLLAGKVDESKLKKRDREAYAAAVNKITEDGPAENIYIDPDTMEQMFQEEGSPMSVEEFFENVPELDIRAFNEARDSGSDFAIPTGIYAAHIAGTPIDQSMSNHIRLAPDDMSAAEADAFVKDLKETQAQMANADTDTVTTLIGDLQGELAAEFTRLKGELQQAGRAPVVAEREAALLAASARTGAARAGMTVSEYLNRYSLPAVRNTDTVGAAPEQPVLDPQLAVELVRSDDASTNTIPDVAAIRERLDEKGVSIAEATADDVVQAARELSDEGLLRSQLPQEERGLPASPDKPDDDEEMMQTATLRVGQEKPEDWGIDTSARMKVREIALKLQARQRKLYGKISKKNRGPKTIEKMASWMADEAEFELQTPEQSALGWYSVKYQRASDILGQSAVPELASDEAAAVSGISGVTTAEDARALFTMLIAVNSNGTDVFKNLDNATNVFRSMTAGGETKTLEHTRAKALNDNMKALMEVVEQEGSATAARDLLLRDISVSEMQKERKARGISAASGFPADMRVPFASVFLGPKLSAFWANLSGAEGYLTMDLWWTRTINRYRGDVLPKVSGLKGDETKTYKGQQVPQGLARFKQLIGRPDLTDAQAFNYVTQYAQAYEQKKYKNGTEAEIAANTIYKAKFKMLDETPAGAADRSFMIAAGERALDVIEERTGERLSMADFQALLWYYEKRLYADMGARDTKDISYEEAAARVAKVKGSTDEFFQSDEVVQDVPISDLLMSEGGVAIATSAVRRQGDEITLSDEPVKVTRTPDGEVYLVDGYHRTVAAREQGGATVRAEFVPFEQVRVLYENERSFEPRPDSALRGDVVSGTEMTGDGRKFTNFFGDVTAGNRQQAQNLDDYVPTVDLPAEVAEFTAAREEVSGNFDRHIKASIPGYAEMQDAVGWTLARMLGDGAVLRVGASEGSTVKAMVKLAGPNATGVAMDPNPQMQNTFNEMDQVEGVTFDLSAFGSAADEGQVLWTEDDGTDIKGFDPQGQKFDVVVEQMVFQFISNERNAQIARVKELMAEDGIFYTAEKFGGPAEQYRANEAKKDAYKAQYFSEEELAAKAQEVLQTGGDAIEGMTDLQVSTDEMEAILRENFEHVVQVWDSGNFKGYAASDSAEKISEFTETLPPLNSEFSTTHTPRTLGDADEFFQDGSAALSDFDADNLSAESFEKNGWFIVAGALDSIGPASNPENRARANELMAWLDENGYEYIMTRGVYKGSPDGNSFLVIGSEQVGEQIGQRWGQETILTNRGLIYTDGSGNEPVPFDGVTMGDAAEREDFHSIPLGRDTKGERRPAFSLNLQFPQPTDVTVDETNGKSHYGAELKDGQMLLTHWSTEQRSVLDPAQAGTGPLPGPERKRSGPKKTFFGLHIGKPYGYQKENKIGMQRHEVSVDPRTMYPYYEDPDGLRDKVNRKLSDTAQVGDYEELIKAAGYKGYFVIGGGDTKKAPLGDVAVMFEAVEPDRVTVDNDASYTRSSAFNEWFEGSVVTNADGSPKMVYHGTRSEFDEFYPGSHFGTARAANQRLDYEERFHTADEGGAWPRGRLIPAYVSLFNPLNAGAEGLSGGTWENQFDMYQQVVNVLVRRGEKDVASLLAEVANRPFTVDGYTYADNLEELEARAASQLAGEEFLADEIQARVREMNELLEDVGYDGIVYENQIEDKGSESYVAFRPEQVKSVFNEGTWDENNPDILLQKGEKKGPRGSIVLPKEMDAQAQINIFERANLSTVLHETGHFFLWQLQKQRNDGLEFATEQYDAVREWWRRNADAITAEAQQDNPSVEKSHVLEFIEVGTTGNGDIDKVVHRALHEQFARGFEAYTMEGKSPNNTLRALFESFAAWLIEVYKRAESLNVELDDNIRSVFDRIIATDDEITAAMDREEVNDQIAETAKEMGMDEEIYRRLRELSEEARDEGKQIARAEMLKAERQMRKKEYQDRLREIDAEETERVNAERHNRVIQWLAYGRWLGEEDDPADLPLELRLDTDLLIEEHGEEIVNKLPRGRRPMHKKGTGLTADEVAGWFGYNSGAEMLRDVSTAPKAKDAISAAVKRRVAEEVGDIMGDPGELEQTVVDALHVDKRGQVIVAELRAINRLGGRDKKITSRGMAKMIAQDLIQKMPVREALQSYRYQNAERRHAEKAARLLAEGDVDGAFEEKRKQLIQHAMYSESRKADEMVSKTERLAGRLKRKGTRENLAPEYLGAIDDILETYDFRQISGKAEVRRERLAAYVEKMKAEGRENELAIPDHVLYNMKRVPYKTLSVKRLKGIHDSLKNIEHTARMKQKLRDAQSERERAAVVADIRNAFSENVEGKPLNRVPTKFDRRMSGVKGYFNLVRNADTILRKIDGWRDRGAMYRYFKDWIDKAGIEAMKMREQATADLDNLFAEYSTGERRSMATRRVWDGYDQAMSKWDLISIALNTGNKDNFERLTSIDSKASFTQDQVTNLLQNLDERDWRFVQGVWDYLNDTYWPQIAAREERVTGVAPEKVEGQMMLDVPGAPGWLKGGYYPIAYDNRFSSKVREDQNVDLMQNMMAGRFGKAQTKNGHTKERASGGGGRSVQLGMHVLFGHINTVIHDLAYGEAVNNTYSLLRDPEVVSEFEDAGMLEDLSALEMWVQDVAAGPAAGTHTLAGTLRRMKAGFTLSKLAFNMSTVAIQVTGVTQSVAVIGADNFTKGLTKYMFSSGSFIRQGRLIKERSPFMAERETSFQRDVFDLTRDVQLDPIGGVSSDLMQLIMKAGFWAMQKVQYYAVDAPTWLGAHEQGMAQGMTDEEAALHADRMVARAQASGLYADRSAIERGTLSTSQRQNEFLRLFTALGSYMFAKYNVAEEVAGRARRDVTGLNAQSVGATLKAMTDMVLLFTVEALMYNAVKGALPGMGGNDDEDEGWAEFLLEETALSVASIFPFVRDVSSVVQGYSGGGAYGGISETIGRGINAAGDLVLGEATASDARAGVDLSGLLVPGIPSTAIWRLVDASGATGEEPSPLAAIMGR